MSERSNTVCYGLAQNTMRLIAKNLPECMANGVSLAARGEVQAVLPPWPTVGLRHGPDGAGSRYAPHRGQPPPLQGSPRYGLRHRAAPR
jgi:hypothetical protein